MKTKQELLDFYGVEIGKKYKVTKIYNGVSNGFLYGTFTITDDSWALGGVQIKLENDEAEFAITLLSHLDYEEIKQPILDDKEREFLQHYVMDNPAFKGKVKYITKTSLSSKATEYIEITTINYNDDFGCFPLFKQGTMYKGMEIGKNYTPQELGLEE